MEEQELSYLDDDAAEDPLSMTALFVAVAAALVGALVWAGIAWTTSYEIGYVAWAIGGLIGFAVVRAGGRGTVLAGVCGVLALLSIFGGKVAAVYFVIEKEIAEFTAQLTPAAYDELRGDATDYAAFSGKDADDQLAGFLASHGYSVSGAASGVTVEEIGFFRDYNGPLLDRLHGGELTYEGWVDETEDSIREEVAANGSYIDYAVEDLGAIDLLFAFLGVSTAFGLVRRAS